MKDEIKVDALRNRSLVDDKELLIVRLDTTMYEDIWKNSLDENNRRFVPDEAFETLEDAKEVVDYLITCYENKDGPFVYVIIRKVDMKNIGYVQLIKIEEGWEIGYHIAQKYCGNSYATKAVSLFLNYLKEHTDLDLIYGIALEDNKASTRVLEKNEFKLVFAGEGLYQGTNRRIAKYIKEL